MLNRYPLWKNLAVVAVVLIGALYALPNIFGQDPSLYITANDDAQLDEALQRRVADVLERAGIEPKRTDLAADNLLVRFASPEDQLRGQEAVASLFTDDSYSHALTLSPDVPGWLTALGGQPMNLGLDLRGGIHVLIDVDMETAVKDRIEGYAGDVRSFLRRERLRYLSITASAGGVEVKFRSAEERDQAERLLGEEYRELELDTREDGDAYIVGLRLTPAGEREIRKAALDQNITTIRNRVNALGVAEPLVQQQGDRRIVVELPGVQDPTRVKDLLSATATLEYRLVDTENDVLDAVNGRVPPGSRLYTVKEDGRPILLNRRVIVTGDQMVDARAGFDQRSGSPAVHVTLDGKGAKRMRDVTTENVGKPMAVVFKEGRVVGRDETGAPVTQWVEEVISVANILEPFGRRFQTTGLDSPQEAHELALLLRAGALAAPIQIVEERTVGPSLGQDNIDQGMISVMVGLGLVMVFMVVYYRFFGLIANIALAVNLVLIVALLSMLQATLTLPGIAGIVLTVGMAVDANVLIFERIREELRVGSTPQASIHAGYDKALSTITDANITTLIAAIVLFSIGSGPVRGFAVTLALGIITSMFTAILGSRAVVNLVYGGKRVTKLAI
jgi:preprotein translocase subunit SecD